MVMTCALPSESAVDLNELPQNRRSALNDVGYHAGGGNVLPSPPKSLQEFGGVRGTRVESRGIDEDVESFPHQQFDRRARLSVNFDIAAA
jgi:hypothetical protein